MISPPRKGLGDIRDRRLPRLDWRNREVNFPEANVPR
jgi:hypothetical protein